MGRFNKRRGAISSRSFPDNALGLHRYNQLAYVMASFTALVSLVTLALVAARSGAFDWPWQLYWVQTTLWEVSSPTTSTAGGSASFSRQPPHIASGSNRFWPSCA